MAEKATAYLAADNIAVGRSLADRLPTALAGGSVFTTLARSLHTKTDADFIKIFLDIDIDFEEIDVLENVRVSVKYKVRLAS